MTRWREALRATPMRLTLRLVALYILISALSFLTTWWLASEALLDASESVLEQELEELAASGDPADIALAVAEGARKADPEHQILRFDGPQGTVGNYLGPLPAGDLRQVDLSDKAAGVEGSYIMRSTRIGEGVLTVGQDTDAFDELREVFGKVLFFTLIPTAVLLLAGGMVIALRSTSRLAAIETTLARLAGGDLTARLPKLPGPRDDLSRVGAGIDRLAAAQEASVAALKQVSTDIAHDLRTPIQRLAVLLDQGLARPEGPDRRDFESASDEVQNIAATFDALLRIAQIEGGASLPVAPVDLSELLRDIAELYEPSAAETGHELRLDITAPVVVQGDRRLLGQAIVNLLENALHHAPPGPVTLGAARSGVAGASLWVADHGPGIPGSERDRVLRRLYRLDRSRQTPGNGLGLSLVAAILSRHGAELELTDNAPGLRATIHFASPENSHAS
ncbi:sensor histidine kinase [Paracoccus aminophilus]|uniref:histidine kinase n=1 Tax=Paracoccus aminophilus JCM 7686 TaxID=1367847 RepID=S5XZQ0_PARAH|nr:HAMP domain-containing sensor histidine kinase [Paracoccus aminophilus]AGT08920.1 integral membrane sensor signal transduction histidine kinase [Paracoccus aminophilus JCM 7686]